MLLYERAIMLIYCFPRWLILTFEKVTLYGASSRQQQDAAEMGVPGAASLLKTIRCRLLKGLGHQMD
jgi:hypothetical protein